MYILSKNCKLLIDAFSGAVFVENLDGGQFILFYDRAVSYQLLVSNWSHINHIILQLQNFPELLSS